MIAVREIPAFECSSCGGRYFARKLAEACVEACTLQRELDTLVEAAGVPKAHAATIAVGPWPDGTDPEAAPGVRVRISWIWVQEMWPRPAKFLHGWGAPRSDDDPDVRPELATTYTRMILRMMKARAIAEERSWDTGTVRAARTT